MKIKKCKRVKRTDYLFEIMTNGSSTLFANFDKENLKGKSLTFQCCEFIPYRCPFFA